MLEDPAERPRTFSANHLIAAMSAAATLLIDMSASFAVNLTRNGKVDLRWDVLVAHGPISAPLGFAGGCEQYAENSKPCTTACKWKSTASIISLSKLLRVCVDASRPTTYLSGVSISARN